MPYPYLTQLPIWIQACEHGTVGESMRLETEDMDNCIFQVMSGHCTISRHKVSHTLGARSLVFLGRKTHADLEGVPGQECRYIKVVLRMVKSVPFLDLNRLCLSAPLIDSFFAQKTRFCLLEDRQYVNMALGEIRYEWENELSERETALRSSLENLLVRIARAFHSQHYYTGIRYITKAKNFIHKYFQQPLTVDDIARDAGISRSYMEALFKRYMRGSIVDYIHAVRCDHAANLLSTTGFPIIEIAMDSGFNNRQHFARVFRDIYGATPSDYRSRNRRALHKPGSGSAAAPIARTPRCPGVETAAGSD